MNRNQATFPSLKRRGGCGINQISRSNRIAADGVVSSAKAFRPNHFSGLTTPSARTKVAPRYFFDRASTPPFQGGEYARPAMHSHLRIDRTYSRFGITRTGSEARDLHSDVPLTV